MVDRPSKSYRDRLLGGPGVTQRHRNGGAAVVTPRRRLATVEK